MTDADKMRFAAAMGLLSGSFGRNVEGAVSATYWTTLVSYELSIEDVERGVAAAIANDTFWPSAARIAELAGADVGDAAAREALAALEDDLNTHGGYRYYPRERFLALPEAVRAGVRRIGGLRSISEGRHERQSVVREFCDAYRDPTKEFAPPAAKLQLLGKQTRSLPRGGEPTRLGEITAARQGPAFDGPHAPRDEYSADYIAAVRAAQAYFATRPDRVNVIRAGIRRQHPSLPDDHIQFRYQLEAALVAAWRESQRLEVAR